MEALTSQPNATAARKPVAKRPPGPSKPPSKPNAPSGDRLVLSGKAKATRPQTRVVPPAPPAPPAPPPVPIAETLSLAVERALQGEAVRTPSRKPLSIQPLAGQSPKAYQVSLDARPITLVASAPEDLARGLEYFEQVPDHLKGSLLSLDLDEVASNTFKVRVKTLEHRDEDLTIKRTASDQGINRYVIQAGDGSFELSTPKDEDLFKGLSETLNLYTQVPEHLRKSLKTLHIDKGASPSDEAFAKQYNLPNFKSAATAGNGGISFWHGTQYVQDAIFHHEFGHVIGQHYSKDGRNLYPDGWEEAIAKDGKHVSDYSQVNPAEDFAETWWVFVTLKQGRTIENQPQSLEEFKALYPHRTPVLEGIYVNQLEPLN